MKNPPERNRSIPQRIVHIDRWISELACWLWRETKPIETWRVSSSEADIADRPIGLGDAWPTLKGVVWFSAGEIEAPADWPIEQTRLVLDFGGEARVFIDYGDRLRTLASDPFHGSLYVEGRRFSLRAEAVARGLEGRPNRDARLTTAYLGRLEGELAEFLAELEVLADGIKAIAGHEAVPSLLALAEWELAHLPWPTETRPFLERMADYPETLIIWDRLVEPVPNPRPLANVHREALVAARARLVEGLAAVRARWPKIGKIKAAGHAHIDYVWLWPRDETIRKALRTFGTQCLLLDRNPAFRFSQSQACLYADIEEHDPALFAEIARHVREGRWEPIGGMWVECDTNMPAAEGFNRQFLYGQGYFRTRFGVTCRTAWLPDTFGFGSALPQLLRAAGMDAMFTIKVDWSETDLMPDNIFRWQGNDGTRVLVHTYNGPGQEGYNLDLRAQGAAEIWRFFKNKDIHDESIVSYGFGDGGGGPTPEQVERVEAMNRLPVVPAVELSSVEGFFDRLREETKDKILPVWRGEMYLECHRATLTTQGRTKALMRRGQAALAAAELLEGLCWMAGGSDGRDYGPEWRTLLRSQFHDALPGSSIREVYIEAEQELSDVLAAADAGCDQALRDLAARVAPGATPGVFAVETAGSAAPNLKLSLKATDAESATALAAQPAADGGWVLSSPLGLRPLEARFVARPPAPAPLSAAARRLENDLVTVRFDDLGRIASIWDKRRKRETLAGPGNQIWAYKDRTRLYDAWDIEANFDLGGAEIVDLESMELTERGPHRAEIVVKRRFGEKSRLTQRYRLWADSARLDIHTTIELGDRRTYLRALFPFAVLADYATFDQALGVTRRPVDENTSWQRAQFESAAHRFVDLSEAGFGAVLANDGKYGHSAKGNVLTISLVRGPTFPDPFADEGRQTFTYSILPHDGRWWSDEVLGEIDGLAGAARAIACRGGDASWRPIAWDGLSLRALAFKRAENGAGRVLRVAEACGARGELDLRLAAGFVCDGEVNTLEESVAPTDRVFTPFRMRSWGIKKA
jgi:alpha-mannosidase